MNQGAGGPCRSLQPLAVPSRPSDRAEVMGAAAPSRTPSAEEAVLAQPGVVCSGPFERAVNEHRARPLASPTPAPADGSSGRALEPSARRPRQQQQRIETTTAAGIAKHPGQ